tara:strand:+ start:146 stop:805 length:660 start_codon:yes stop_codon:yes gene_type:complete
MSAGFIDGNTSFTKNIHGETGVAGSSNLDLIRDYHRLQILFNRIIFQLKPPMQLYSDGDFEDFIVSMPNILTFSTNINDDSVFYYDNENDLLTDFEYDPDLVSNYRSLSNSLVNVLKQGISEYYKIKNLEQENTTLLSYKEILQDRTRLLEYLGEIQKTSYLFSAEATYTNNLEIKLWYQVYLERHGAPGDGVFDSELLSVIIDELVASGQVSEDELIY